MDDIEVQCVEALQPQDQQRMAVYALAGWTFSMHAACTWAAKKPGWFDQYGSSLLNCLDRLDRATEYGKRHGDGTWDFPDPRMPLRTARSLPDAAKMAGSIYEPMVPNHLGQKN